jgi:hypothetical protein
MGVDAFDLAVGGRYGVVGAASPAVADMLAALTFLVHILLEGSHAHTRCRLCQILLAGTIPDMTHDVFRHSHEAIAGIDAAVRAHCKGILHAVYKGADRAPSCEDTPGVVVDVSYFYLGHVFQVLVQQLIERILDF